MSKFTDTERLDFLANECRGFALVSDDFGHWALVMDGFQSIPDEAPGDVATTFFIEAKDWRKSPREAIDAVMEAMRARKESE